jgi:hypothetical protein
VARKTSEQYRLIFFKSEIRDHVTDDGSEGVTIVKAEWG